MRSDKRLIDESNSQYLRLLWRELRAARMSYRLAAETLGRELVRRDIGLVYGGGSVGLMGVLARTVHERGGDVLGVIPEPLTTREMAGDNIGETIVVETMHERKALMNEHSDAFIALPGGFGTLDELFEAITWGQLGIHRKPIGLLNVDGYFDPLLQWIDHRSRKGFVRPHHRHCFSPATTPRC